MRPKYQPLEDYLKSRRNGAQQVTLSFAEIEDMLGDRLPPSAYNYREWWANQSDVSNRPHARAWISAGYEVETVHQPPRGKTVRFKRRHAWGLPMNWSPEAVIEDFRPAAKLAGIDLGPDDIVIEILPAPHRPPTRLPPGQMAVYVFCKGDSVLKVGKAGPRSEARYTSQHYNPGSAGSTLARSLLTDREAPGSGAFDESNVKQWIKAHTDRVNFLLDAECGIAVLTLLEAFLQCRLKPRYEGSKNQS